MATRRRPPDDPDIPDLDVGASPPVKSGSTSGRTSGNHAQPVSAPPSAPVPSRGPEDYFGAGTFDADHFEGSNVTIALDTGESPDIPLAEKAQDGDLDLYEGSTAGARARERVPGSSSDRRQWPTGTSPDLPSLRIDAVDLALAADYGPVPGSLLAAPVYALRVLARKRALREKMKELSAVFEQASRNRDELLATMVQDLRGKILMAEQGGALFEPIVTIERVALERRSAATGTSADYDARAADLADRSRAIGQEAADHRTVVEQREAALAELVRAFERADAKKKRLYIELGGLVRISEKTGGKLTPDQAASVERLEAEIAAQKAELEARTRAVDASKASLVLAQSDERQIVGRTRDLDRLRQALDVEFQKEIGARNEGVTTAEQQRFLALAELGCKVLAEKGRLVDVPPEALAGIAHADQAVLDRALELEKHVRAMDAYDAEAVRKGIGILAIGLACVLVALALLVRAIF
jgi:hypothetical protein